MHANIRLVTKDFNWREEIPKLRNMSIRILEYFKLEAREEAIKELMICFFHKSASNGQTEILRELMNLSTEKEISYERMEWVGDGALGHMINRFLEARYTSSSEGELTQKKSKIASREGLNIFFQKTSIFSSIYILVNLDIKNLLETTVQAFKEDFVEAVLGVISKFYSLDTFASVCKEYFDPIAISILESDANHDYVSELHETCSKYRFGNPTYSRCGTKHIMSILELKVEASTKQDCAKMILESKEFRDAISIMTLHMNEDVKGDEWYTKFVSIFKSDQKEKVENSKYIIELGSLGILSVDQYTVDMYCTCYKGKTHHEQSIAFSKSKARQMLRTKLCIRHEQECK